MKKIILTSVTLFGFVFFVGCGLFDGDDNGDDKKGASSATSGAATTSQADTTSGVSATGDKTPQPPTVPDGYCDLTHNTVEKVMVAQIICSRTIPTEHVLKANYYSVKEGLSETEQSAVVTACGYKNNFVINQVSPVNINNCKSSSPGSKLCLNMSQAWEDGLEQKEYRCIRAEAVSLSQYLEQVGYKKVDDKYVKE